MHLKVFLKLKKPYKLSLLDKYIKKNQKSHWAEFFNKKRVFSNPASRPAPRWTTSSSGTCSGCRSWSASTPCWIGCSGTSWRSWWCATRAFAALFHRRWSSERVRPTGRPPVSLRRRAETYLLTRCFFTSLPDPVIFLASRIHHFCLKYGFGSGSGSYLFTPFFILLDIDTCHIGCRYTENCYCTF